MAYFLLQTLLFALIVIPRCAGINRLLYGNRRG